MDLADRRSSRPYWRRLGDGRVECGVCPRLCKLEEGARGYCRMRVNRDAAIHFSPLGRNAGVRIEPVEAHSLLHFLPGTLALAVGKGGTNLVSRFQWNGPSRPEPGGKRLPDLTEPAEIAIWAQDLSCPSVVLGCTEPAVMHEYAIAVARACRAAGLKTVALTRGYLCPGPRSQLFRHIDAVRLELMGFRESFYWKHCDGHIAPVKDTLAYLAGLENVWLEIAVPLVPGENDAVGDIERFSRWLVDSFGPGIPLHFRTSHLIATRPPRERQRAAVAAARARRVAHAAGMQHVYSDDLFDAGARATTCEVRGRQLIGREWYLLSEWNLTEDHRCIGCGTRLAGVFRGCPPAGSDWLGIEAAAPVPACGHAG